MVLLVDASLVKLGHHISFLIAMKLTMEWKAAQNYEAVTPLKYNNLAQREATSGLQLSIFRMFSK